jgi:hypothetical protein
MIRTNAAEILVVMTVCAEFVAVAAAVVVAPRIAVVVAGLTLIQVMGGIVVVTDVAVIVTMMRGVMILATLHMIAIAADAKAGQDQEADLDPDHEKGITAVVIAKEKRREGVLNVIDLDHQTFDVIRKNLVTPDDHLAVIAMKILSPTVFPTAIL